MPGAVRPWDPRPALALSGVLLIAAALRLAFLDQNGFGTLYYAAAVRSMAAGGHNFFFAAFDPAGFLAIDKPPLAFWAQVASVRLLGYGGLALHLPQVLEGVAAVALLHYLVARRFGRPAGLLAALFLALTPISVAVDRSNNTDACLVLAQLAAAWPLVLAAERASLRLLLLSAVLLGLAFWVKMAAALLVLPAFVALYLLTAPATWARRIGHLAAAAAVLAAVALAWPFAVDLTPKERRPYVDSTATNSAIELAIGHNAVDRFVRPSWLGTDGRTTATAASAPAAGRLAAPALASQVGWLAVLTLAGLVLMGDWRARLLWGGWAAACVGVFSAAGGIFLPYYLAVLAPPIAAGAAVAVVRLTAAPRAWAAVLAVAAASQAVLAWVAAGAWGPWVAAAPVAMAAIAIALALRRRARAAVAAGVAGLLVAPFLWSLGPMLAPGSVTYPSARFPLVDPARPERAERRLPNRDRLVAFLDRQAGDRRFLLATTSVVEAASLVVRTGRPVMLLGGFTGVTPAIGLDAFRRRVAAGEIRHVLVAGTLRPPEGPRAPVIDWVRANGREIAPELWRPRLPEAADEATARRRAYLAGLRLYQLGPGGTEGSPGRANGGTSANVPPFGRSNWGSLVAEDGFEPPTKGL